jgi:adenylate cyclase
VTSSDSSPGARWRLIALGFLVSLVVGVLYLRPPSLLGYLDQRVYDVLLRSAHHTELSGRIVVVDVDENSLARLGRWPWPRARLAQLLTRIRELGAVSVGLDMVFPEADDSPVSPSEPARTSPQRDSSAERTGLTANDAALADALARGPFVLGYGLSFEAERPRRAPCVLHPLPVVWVHRPVGSDATPLFRASPGVCSLPGLARAAPASGFINAAPDRDGIMRRIPLLMTYEGAVYPSLGLATLVMALRPKQTVLRTTGTDVEALVVENVSVPLDSRGALLLNFGGGKGAFPHVSAADILERRVSNAALRDRIVFLGSTALGLRDTVATPLDTTYPGVELHATVADTILRKAFIRRPRVAPTIELLLTMAAGPIAALSVVAIGVTWSAALLGAIAVGLWLGADWLLKAQGIFISPLFPIMAIGACFPVLTVVSFLRERVRADQSAKNLRQARDLLLYSLTSLTNTRDQETGSHLFRTQGYMQALCKDLSTHPRFRDFLTPETVDLVARLAPIHDIGKVGVADLILKKPGPLTEREWKEMRRHPEFGHQVIANAERRAGIHNDVLLRLAKDVVHTHHERWDGSGYPRGLVADQIPIAGRLVAIVDVYDALVSKRVYKDRIPHDEAMQVILTKKATHFDPDVVDAVWRVHEEWRRISLTIGDGATDSMHP